jgi:hypothetical protein
LFFGGTDARWIVIPLGRLATFAKPIIRDDGFESYVFNLGCEASETGDTADVLGPRIGARPLSR